MLATEMGRLEVNNNSLALLAETMVVQMLEPEQIRVFDIFAAVYGERWPGVSTCVSDRYSDDVDDDDDDERSEDAFALLSAMAPGCRDIEEAGERRGEAE